MSIFNRTAPSLSVGNMYQVLIILAMYKGHLLPICKVVMTGKTRKILYDAAFAKVKEARSNNAAESRWNCRV